MMRGVCPECKVRNNDPSQKELYKCPLCGREFCADHLDPKFAFFSARFKISESIKDPIIRKIIEEELKVETGHPCVPYTKRRLEELRLAQKQTAEIFNRLLNSGKRRYFRFPKAIQEVEGRCRECGGSLIRDAETGEVFCSACGLVHEKIKTQPPKETLPKISKTEKVTYKPQAKKTYKTASFPTVEPKRIKKRMRSRSLYKALLLTVTVSLIPYIALNYQSFMNLLSSLHFPQLPSLSQLLQPVNITQVEADVFKLINEERVSRGLPRLSLDPKLAKAAKEWSMELASKGKLEHGAFAERMRSIGYLYKYECGEIIAYYSESSYDLARIFVDAWLDSPGHRKIMLTAKHGSMGVGVSKGKDGYYAVVDFKFED